mgnify:CR=1 FL=1
MKKEVIDKLDEIEELIKNDKDINELKKLRKEIENDKELLNKINKLKNMDKYNINYVNLKKEILNNISYKRYITLENNLYLLVQQINIKLNSLKEKSRCRWKLLVVNLKVELLKVMT